MSILNKIKSPSDVKKLEKFELPLLAMELREKIIDVTSKNGGHVGPNLGVVELTIALHRVFSTPKDKFVFDVSHQCYTHKLLTGRNDEKFNLLRKTDGYCGFTNMNESPHDVAHSGHAGTAVSVALGLAVARDIKGDNENVVAIVGDAALTNGVTLEAFNCVSESTKKLTVILNDNKMSISKNVGAISSYLNEIITNPTYNRLHEDLESFLKKYPIGQKVAKIASKAISETKDFFVESSLFEKFGFRYLGPIDGHNISLLEQYLEFCKNSPEPVLLHIVTQKGKGLDCALKNPEKFHGASPYCIKTGSSTEASDPNIMAYQDVMGKTLVKLAEKDPDIVGITAAMASGTGMNHLKNSLPRQFFDVGIAEEHAVVFASGMSARGLKPVTAIYSTFMQRAFDCAMHDFCLQNLSGVFCLDRAGLSAQDGATHHGMFDISYLRCLPRAILMQPSNEDELADMLYTSIYSGKQCFIRYPRGKGIGINIKEYPEKIEIGKAVEIKKPEGEIVFWALGNMVSVAENISKKLEEQNIKSGVVNARFVKPLDEELLLEHAKSNKLIVTLEDHTEVGGFGSAVSECLAKNGAKISLEIIGWKDEFIPHGSSVSDLRKRYGLDEDSIFNKVQNRYKNL